MDVLTTDIVEPVRNQEQPTNTVLSSLLAIQVAMRYIPKQSMEAVSSDVPCTNVNVLCAVALFYITLSKKKIICFFIYFFNCLFFFGGGCASLLNAGRAGSRPQ